MVGEVVRGGVYQHYKGNQYIVRDLAKHSETLEWMVIYECLYENPEGKIWVRPLSMFLEEVMLHGQLIPRFKYLADS